jgi:hypothetical protein
MYSDQSLDQGKRMTSNGGFPQIFSRLCHVAALTREGKTRAAIDSLVVTVLALDPTFAPTTATEVRDALNSVFGLKFAEATIQSSIDRKLTNRQLLRDRVSKRLTLEPGVRREVEAHINTAERLEKEVRDEWFSSLDTEEPLTPAEQEELWDGLRSYMARAFQRHGIETMVLLDPSQPVSDESKDNLSTYLEEATIKCCKQVPHESAIKWISQFFVDATPLRTKYIAQLLDGTFTYFALTIDDATSTYLKEGIRDLSLFLDTNFIFALLNLHTSPLNDVSQELIETIKEQKLPFKIYYHEETLLELRRTIGSIADGLKGRHWTQALSGAALKTGIVSGLEQKYHQLNAESPIDPEIFFSKYEYIEELLKEQGFKIYRTNSTPELDSERHHLVAEYKNFIDTHRPARPKGYAALNHDIAVWQTIKHLQRKGASVFESGAFLLTTDFYLYRFDWQKLRDNNSIGTVMLSNQFMQLLRPFVPTGGRSDQHFIELFAIPEFRSAVSDYAATGHKVLSYLSSYSDVGEQTAIRMLTNEVLMQQVRDVDPESEQFQHLVDSALARDNEELLRRERAAREEATLAAKRASEAAAELARREAELNRERQKSSEATRKADEASNALNEIQAEMSAKVQSKELKVQALNTRLDRYAIITRVAVGSLFFLFGIAAIIFLPWYFSWMWLRDHPNRLGLYGCAILLMTGISWAIIDVKRRGIALLSIVAAVIIAMLQILGR